MNILAYKVNIFRSKLYSMCVQSSLEIYWLNVTQSLHNGRNLNQTLCIQSLQMAYDR